MVIGRVKELLGLKPDVKPATSGRLVTPPGAPTERKLPAAQTPPSVTSMRPAPSQWDQLRDRTGLDVNTRSVEDPSTRGDDYLDTFDEAFDSLDRQISGRPPKQQRNPSGPLGQSTGAADPRSPGRRPVAGPQAGNPVFEVDDEWFGAGETAARADARAGRRDIVEDLRDPELQVPKPATPDPIYEVDDAWFAEDEKTRAQRAAEQQQLAAEMGLHDMDLAPAAADAVSKAEDLDFSLDDLHQVQAAPIAPAPEAAPAAPVAHVAPAAHAAPAPAIVPMAPISSVAPSSPVATETSPIADDFAALLAFEQGEQPHPPVVAAPEIKVVTPEITEQMLDQIAERVATRLNASAFGDELKAALTATMRDTVIDTVRTVVSEISERLVRDEIDRIKSKSRT